MQFTVRKMQESDIEAVTEAAIEFFHESDAGKTLTLRADKYRAMLRQYLTHSYVRSFVCYAADGAVAGYIHIYCQDDYTEELIGELYQFYVRAPYRGTGAARLLIDAADKQYREWGCVRAYSEEAHGALNGRMMSTKLFENLWGKFGFASMGTVMMKEY